MELKRIQLSFFHFSLCYNLTYHPKECQFNFSELTNLTSMTKVAIKFFKKKSSLSNYFPSFMAQAQFYTIQTRVIDPKLKEII